MASQPETITTPRLAVRKPRRDDARAVLSLLQDDRVVEHNPSGRLDGLADAKVLIDRWLEHWKAHGFGNGCVVDRATGALVGNCGLRWMRVHDQSVLNLMVRFSPATWGRGLATEATAALLDWADVGLPGEVVLARIRPRNLASQSVARKLGLVREPALDDVGEDGIDWAFTHRTGTSRS